MPPSPIEQQPLVAYVLLWFPLSSETFVFREVRALQGLGMPIDVYTLYGKSMRGCSRAMLDYDGPVRRLGSRSFLPIMGAFFRAVKNKPRQVAQLMRRGLFRRMRNLESLAENTWAFFCGFLLAEQCSARGTKLLHAPWANGPATAAWVAAAMSGIPFAFTGRAGDIYPQDGILAEKAADAVFIRTNNTANVDWLASFCPPDKRSKVRLVYNNLVFDEPPLTPRRQPKPPYRILAIGRFARTKGFPELLTAMARLKRENFPVRLTLVGDGSWKGRLLELRKKLGLEEIVDMPGFAPNDIIGNIMAENDILVVPSVVYSNGDRDGIPNVIMEAMSLKMPVVATNVCGISEVVRKGETGLLVEQRDPAALANAIREMFENWPRAIEMANKGSALVKEMFDPQKNTASLLHLYASAIREQTNVRDPKSGC